DHSDDPERFGLPPELHLASPGGSEMKSGFQRNKCDPENDRPSNGVTDKEPDLPHWIARVRKVRKVFEFYVGHFASPCPCEGYAKQGHSRFQKGLAGAPLIHSSLHR